jgi:hypothetical protein
MPALVIPGATKIEMLGTLAGRQCVNVMGGIVDSGVAPTVPTLNDWADTILTVWKSTLLPLFSDAYTISSVRITSLQTATSPQVTISNPGNGAKANGSSAQVAQIIKLVTAIRSRASRGRVYLPPPGDADVNSAGILLAQQVQDLQAAWTTLYNVMRLDGLNPAILSRTLLLAFEVTSFTVDSKVATQRRRLRG